MSGNPVKFKLGSIVKSDHMEIPIKLAGKSLESFIDLHQGWNFLGYKFLTIAVSFMDMERGIQCP